MDTEGYGRWFHRVRDRLTVLPRRLTLLSLAVMAAVGIESGCLLEQDWIHIERDYRQVAWNQALSIADSVNASLWQMDARLDTITEDSNGDRDPAVVKARMAEAIRLMPDQVAALLAVDDHGRVKFSTTDRFKPGTDVSDLDAFKAAARTHEMALGLPLRIGGEQWLPQARIVHQPGVEDHIGVSMIRLAKFEQLLAAEVREPGDVVAVFEIGGAEILRSPAPKPGSDPYAAGAALAAGLGNAESASAFEISSVDHVSRLSVVMRAGGSPLGVLVAIPTAMLWHSWWPHATGVIVMTIFLLGLLAAFHLAFAAELQRRYEAEATAERIGAQYRLLAEHCSDLLMEVGFDSGFRYVSPATERLLGWTQEEMVGAEPRDYTHPEDLPLTSELIEGLSPESGPQMIRFRHLCKNGSYLWVEASVQLTCRDGIPDGFVAVLRDISDRIEAERLLAESSSELERLATTDALTGVANRRRFDQELEREWGRSARDRIPLSLLMFDIDYFKRYNDSYGHNGGDDALKAVARAATGTLRRSADLAARWGGEEFAFLLPGTDLTGALLVAEAVRAAVEALEIPHRDAPRGRLTVSVGVVTCYPSLNQAPKNFIAEADANLYMAKRLGRNRVVGPHVAAALAMEFALTSGD